MILFVTWSSKFGVNEFLCYHSITEKIKLYIDRHIICIKNTKATFVAQRKYNKSVDNRLYMQKIIYNRHHALYPCWLKIATSITTENIQMCLVKYYCFKPIIVRIQLNLSDRRNIRVSIV